MGPYAEIPSRRKVTIVALLASLSSVGLVLLALLAYRMQQSEQDALKTADIQAETIARKVSLPLLSNDVAVAQNILEELNRSRIVAACAYTRDGKVFATFVRDATHDFEFPLPELDSFKMHDGALDLFHAIVHGDDIVGTLYLHAEAGSRLAALPHSTAIIGGLAIVLLVCVVVFAGRLRRLLKLYAVDTTGVIPLIAPGAVDAMAALPDVSRDELRLVDRKVDALAVRVHKVEEQLSKPAEPKGPSPPSMIESDQPVKSETPVASSFDLNAATQRVLQVMRDKIEARNAEVIVQTNLPFVLADNAVVEQVLRSLIENALKFCPENSRPRIRVGGCINGDAVRLWVHDNGIGIAPEQHKVVFASTGRADEASLALVKQRVEKMRGQVGFDSAAGQGSTFWIELPKSQAATLN